MKKDAESKSFGEILKTRPTNCPWKSRKNSSKFYPVVLWIADVTSLAGIFEMHARNLKRGGSGQPPPMTLCRKFSHEASAAALQLLCSCSSAAY